MDLRSYYKKVRDAEAALPEEHMVMVSLATSEGGKEGVRTEASRAVAARLIAEGRSRLATGGETLAFHEAHREARARHEQEEAARRVQVMLLPAPDTRKTKERS
jgi:hypothetical protein